MNLTNFTGRYLVPRGDENLSTWDGLRKGHYEAWFLTFNDPAQRTAYWLRYTLESPQHSQPYAELWGHYFDGNNPERCFGLRRRVGLEEFKLGGDSIIRIGEARLTEHLLHGALEGHGHSLSWELSHESSPRALFMAPAILRPVLGRKRTNWLVPNIDVRYQGKVVVDGRSFELKEAPGQQGHVYGHQHADRWAWVHCNSFDHGRSAVLTGVAVTFGGLPRMLTGIYVRYEGQDYLCNALPASLLDRSEVQFPEFRFWARHGGTEFIGQAKLRIETSLQVKYEDPDGTPSYCSNSELADLTLEVRRRGRPVDRLTATGTAHLEFGDRQQRPELPLVPGP